MISRTQHALKNLRQRLVGQHLRMAGFSLLLLFLLLSLQFDATPLLVPVPELVPPSGLRVLGVLITVALVVLLGMTGYLAPGVRYLKDSDRIAGITVQELRERARNLARKLGLQPPRFRVAALESVPFLAVMDRPGSRNDLLLVPTRPEILRDAPLDAVLAHEVGHLWAHTGLQNALRLVYLAPFRVLRYAGYVLIYGAYLPRVGPLLALFPAVVYGLGFQTLIQLLGTRTLLRWNTAIAYTNEFLADTVALGLLDLEAVANMLVRVHYRILVQALMEDLAAYLERLAPYLSLPQKEVHQEVREALRQALEQHPYSVHQASGTLLRRFLERFGHALGIPLLPEGPVDSKDLLSLLLERIPRRHRFAVARRTPATVLALDEPGPERYDRYPPYGWLDPGELRTLVQQAREAGRLSIADLPSDTHPSILARLQHLLWVAGLGQPGQVL